MQRIGFWLGVCLFVLLMALDPLAGRPSAGLPIAPPEPGATVVVQTTPSRKLPVWVIPAVAVAVVLIAALAGRGADRCSPGSRPRPRP